MQSGILAVVTFTIDGSAAGGSVDDFLPDTRIVSAGDTGGNSVDVSTFGLTIGDLTVNAGPQPAFTGTPSGLTMAAGQGDPDPSGSLSITNTGDASTTLTGTCTLTGDAELTVTNGAFSVAQGAAAAVVGVACDASTQGSYSSTLSCAHNGSNASPVDYAVSCEIAPPGAAVFQSSPAVGSTIEMTPEDVPEGTAVPDQVLTFTNAATNANDNDLNMSCNYTGDPAISVIAPNSPIAPMDSATAVFSCDTSAVGAYTGTYTCDYSTDGDAQTLPSSATYTVNCGVRAAEAEMDVSPAPGQLSMSVPMGGSGNAFISFAEILNEGVDATIVSCSLASGADFEVITTLPMDVPAGGSAQVQI